MWDVFISHAWEDKDTVARPLAQMLTQAGLAVWYDEFTLTLGDSLRRSIDRGLGQSRYGVVILSHSFFSKEWPSRELDGLAARESDSVKVILPVWHGITRQDVLHYSPILADKLSVSTSAGLDVVAKEIVRAVPPHGRGSREKFSKEAQARPARKTALHQERSPDQPEKPRQQDVDPQAMSQGGHPPNRQTFRRRVWLTSGILLLAGGIYLSVTLGEGNGQNHPQQSSGDTLGTPTVEHGGGNDNNSAKSSGSQDASDVSKRTPSVVKEKDRGNQSAPASNAPGISPTSPEETNPAKFFLVEVAVVANREDADLLRLALQKRQYPAFVTFYSARFHVQLGPYTTDEAEAMRVRLVHEGYDPLLRLDKPIFVQAAAVSRQEDADVLLAALQKKQYRAFTVFEEGLFHVQVGPYSENQINEAESVRSRLAKEGYNPVIVSTPRKSE